MSTADNYPNVDLEMLEDDLDEYRGSRNYSNLESYVHRVVDAIEDSVYWDEDTGEVMYGMENMKIKNLTFKIHGRNTNKTKWGSRYSSAMKALNDLGMVEKSRFEPDSENAKNMWNVGNSNIYELRAVRDLLNEELNI